MMTNIFKRTFSTAGSLLTWGETTYGWGRPINQSLRTPDFVTGFNNVVNVSTGPYHMVFLNSSSEVYSVGLGTNGRLGHRTDETLETPQRIEYFSENNIKIKQISAGYRHNLGISENGKTYSWGFGGGNPFLYKYVKAFRRDSPLGNGLKMDSYEPTQIEPLSGEKIVQISAGKDFSLALNDKGKVFGWGSGLRNFDIETSSIPKQIEEISHLAHKKHAHVKKIASAHTFTFVLFDNGRLYTFGTNNGGVLGTRQNPLIITDNKLKELTKVNDTFYGSEKIVDFAVSANSLIFLTESGLVYFSGMHLKFRPQRYPLSTSVKNIFATYDSVGIVDNNNQITYINDQILDESDKNNDLYTCQQPNLEGDVISIGGTYKLRYAIIKK